MNSDSQSAPQSLTQGFLRWKWLWITTTAACTLAGVWYSQSISSAKWKASQSLLIPQASTGLSESEFAGAFLSKANETELLALVRSENVLAQALNTIASAEKEFGQSSKLPSVEELAEQLTVQTEFSSENDAQFVRFEVGHSDSHQAVALNSAIVDEATRRLSQIRTAELEGRIEELETTLAAARSNLGQKREQLQTLQQTDGSKQTLASLKEPQVEEQLKSVARERATLESDFQTAQSYAADLPRILQGRSGLIDGYSNLGELRRAWAAADVHVTKLRANLTDAHPLVIAALETESRIETELQATLNVTIQELTQKLDATDSRLAALLQQQQHRETQMAEFRTEQSEHEFLTRELASREEQIRSFEKKLAAAEAARDSLADNPLLRRIDEPSLQELAGGPNDSTIVAGAGLTGMLLGCGVVFMLMPLDAGLRRRDPDANSATESGLDDQQQHDEPKREQLTTTCSSEPNKIEFTVSQSPTVEVSATEDATLRGSTEPTQDLERPAIEQAVTTSEAEQTAHKTFSKFSEEADAPPRPK